MFDSPRLRYICSIESQECMNRPPTQCSYPNSPLNFDNINPILFLSVNLTYFLSSFPFLWNRLSQINFSHFDPFLLDYNNSGRSIILQNTVHIPNLRMIQYHYLVKLPFLQLLMKQHQKIFMGIDDKFSCNWFDCSF